MKPLAKPANQLCHYLPSMRALEVFHLLFLNVCESGHSVSPFVVCPKRVRQQSLPVILAIRSKLTTKTEIKLLRVFYEALFEGFALDIAITKERKIIDFYCSDIEWNTPILFAREDIKPRVTPDQPATKQFTSQRPEPAAYHFRQQQSKAKLADKVATKLTSFLPSSVSPEDRNGAISVMCETCQEACGSLSFYLRLVNETIGMLGYITHCHMKALIPEHSLLRKLF